MGLTIFILCKKSNSYSDASYRLAIDPKILQLDSRTVTGLESCERFKDTGKTLK